VSVYEWMDTHSVGSFSLDTPYFLFQQAKLLTLGFKALCY
jgi:hypothetical protein